MMGMEWVINVRRKNLLGMVDMKQMRYYIRNAVEGSIWYGRERYCLVK